MNMCYVYPEYSHNKENDKTCLFGHIQLMMKEWDKIKKRYIPTLKRLIRKTLGKQKPEENLSELADSIVKLTITFHDYGKLAQEYKTRKGYLHEILGTYILVSARKKQDRLQDLLSLAAISILLHHEHRIYEKIKPQYTGTTIFDKTAWNLLKKQMTRAIKGKTIHVNVDANKSIETILKTTLNNETTKEIKIQLENNYEINTIFNTLQTLTEYITTGKKGFKYLTLTSLLNHILVLLDIRAANQTRKKEKTNKYFKLLITQGRKPLTPKKTNKHIPNFSHKPLS